jgi:hypothetical protein
VPLQNCVAPFAEQTWPDEMTVPSGQVNVFNEQLCPEKMTVPFGQVNVVVEQTCPTAITEPSGHVCVADVEFTQLDEPGMKTPLQVMPPAPVSPQAVPVA